jgi:hypothetical protein
MLLHFIEDRRQSALEIAIEGGTVKCAAFLLAAGARADVLPDAVLRCSVQHPPCALAALEQGAKVPVGDSHMLKAAVTMYDSAMLVRALIADGATFDFLPPIGLRTYQRDFV